MIRDKQNLKEPIWLLVTRLLLGALFIFSSFVKGVDPLGTAYRIEDYLDAYGWYALYDYALILGIFLILVEFLLGVAMFFKLQPKLASLGVLLIMIIFTLLTFFDALYEMVPDCGCFGDAVKLSNWGTFYKNVVFILMAILVFAYRKYLVSGMTVFTQFAIILMFTLLFGWFNYYNIAHLPMMDFRDWKIGRDMRSTGLDEAKTFLTYQNNETGELKEYESPNYPWNDSVWMSEWSFVNQRIDETGVDRKHGLIIEDLDGNDLTEEIIAYPGFQFLLVSPDLDMVDIKHMKKAAQIYEFLMDSDAGFAMITSSGPDIIESYSDNFSVSYDVFLGDDIEQKAMIRSNPGLILLYDGTVIDKWHCNDFPDVEDLAELMKSYQDN